MARTARSLSDADKKIIRAFLNRVETVHSSNLSLTPGYANAHSRYQSKTAGGNPMSVQSSHSASSRSAVRTKEAKAKM
jgi:hypothetical protein